MDITFKRSWAEIDLARLTENYRTVEQRLVPGQKIMAVVKSDAYGHGDVEVALALQSAGCCLFGVATLQEAIRLREASVRGDILILGYTPVSCAGELVDYDVTQTLLNADYAVSLAKQGLPVKCQFAVDTGMTRIGLDGADVDGCERTVRAFSDNGPLRVTGIFTHLSSADMEDEASAAYTDEQLASFGALVRRLEDLKLPYVHCLNSAGCLRHNAGLGNVVRAGIVLYGLEPDDSDPQKDGLAPVLTWHSVVSEIHRVGKGVSVSYGRTFVTPEAMTLAVIPTGYADGYNRLLSNRGHVLIHGKPAPIVGRVCMDQMMVDITHIPEACVEDEVVLIGTDGDESITASDVARASSTIGYETVCAISKRIPRVYVNAPEQ